MRARALSTSLLTVLLALASLGLGAVPASAQTTHEASPIPVSGDFAAAWARAGGATGWLGSPTSRRTCTLVKDGCAQRFDGGWIYSSATTPAHVVPRQIHATWAALRREQGFLGFPTKDPTCDAARSRCTQRFQGATLTWKRGARANVKELADEASQYVVVNKRRPFSPKSFAPAHLVKAPGSSQRVQKKVLAPLTKLLAAAKRAGAPLYVRSGYRSYAAQKSTYSGWVRQLGKARADEVSARAGYSEHQTGLAVDVLNATGSCARFGCFASTKAGRWVAKNAGRYGFVVRYRAGQERITGYDAEAWHLRYVGKKLAADMKAKGSRSLEEHFGLHAAPGY